MCDEAARGRAAPLGITGWKVLADVARCRRAENGIYHRVQAHIGITMAGKAAMMFYADPAKPQFFSIREAVDVETCADTWGRDRGGAHEILRKSEFPQSFITIDERDFQRGGTRNLRVIPGRWIALPGPMGRKNGVITESLRRLHAAKYVPIRTSGHEAVFRNCQTVHHGQHWNGASMILKGEKQAIDHFRRTIRPRGIVDQHKRRRIFGERLKRGAN